MEGIIHMTSNKEEKITRQWCLVPYYTAPQLEQPKLLDLHETALFTGTPHPIAV